MTGRAGQKKMTFLEQGTADETAKYDETETFLKENFENWH